MVCQLHSRNIFYQGIKQNGTTPSTLFSSSAVPAKPKHISYDVNHCNYKKQPHITEIGAIPQFSNSIAKKLFIHKIVIVIVIIGQ